MPAETVRAGRSIDWLAENSLGGKELRIIALMDLHNALYGVEQEFEHDDSEEAKQLLREVKGLTMTVDRLSLTDDGDLTLYRECSRCSGRGATAGEDPCVDCGGTGAIHAEEADG
jgi:DnaJ-class molecular chaperone